MATIDVTTTPYGSHRRMYSWDDITENDEGKSVLVDKLTNLVVQTTGDFTTSGAITWEGSNDNTNWATLTDHLGNAATQTDTTPMTLGIETLYIRPNASAGTSVAMDCKLTGVIIQ